MNDSDRMPLKVFFALKPGQTYRVSWAKDDDTENGMRLNYTRQTVESNVEGVILSDGYEWSKDEIPKWPDATDKNILDTGRGLAYFYY